MQALLKQQHACWSGIRTNSMLTTKTVKIKTPQTMPSEYMQALIARRGAATECF